jgi:hypothetical protein
MQYSRHLEEVVLDSLHNKALSIHTDGVTDGEKTEMLLSRQQATDYFSLIYWICR